MHKLIDRPTEGEGSPATRPSPPAIEPGRDALFLDLDGTLAPIRPRPEDVGPDARRNALLRRLSERLDGRLAVVTGRALDDVERILEGASATLAAVHGLVIRTPDGRVSAPEPAEGVARAREALLAFAEGREGLLVEDKGISVGLHFRNAPHLQAESVRLGAELAERFGLSPQPGDMLFELRTPGADKGSAVRRLMDLPVFAGTRPIFIGDDLTDEYGFMAARELGGHGVLVGDRVELTAEYRLPDHLAVLDWLEAAVR